MKKAFAAILALLLLSVYGAACGESHTVKGLRISEIMASNKVTLEDAFGRYPDWLEIYNTTDAPISLRGVCLSDDKEELQKYVFPEDAVIQPGEYMIVFASGAKKDIADEYHTSFKLSAAGEAIYLSHEGILLDSMLFEQLDEDISWALDDNDQYMLTVTPTPGRSNIITEM